jgi:hypothetical protein
VPVGDAEDVRQIRSRIAGTTKRGPCGVRFDSLDRRSY